tara:strand:- start:392 stop:790 length:399 start_codon:yes stop_codon:yes gene_type:complete
MAANKSKYYYDYTRNMSYEEIKKTECNNMKDCSKTAEQFQESLNEWDTIFDPAEKPEYSQEQLIRFAELFLDYKLSNRKDCVCVSNCNENKDECTCQRKSDAFFETWTKSLEEQEQPKCDIENQEDCENCGS